MKTPVKLLYWAPRIICILAILLVSVFALDAFSPELSIGQQILAFLLHLVPSFILLAILLVAWKWERLGGIILILLGVVFTVIVFRHNYRMNQSFWMSLGIVVIMTVPFIIAGILFIINHYKKRP